MKAIIPTSLVTLTAVLNIFAQTTSQAKSLSELANPCSAKAITTDFLTITPDNLSAQPCLQTIVDTIYDPLPTRQPQL